MTRLARLLVIFTFFTGCTAIDTAPIRAKPNRSGRIVLPTPRTVITTEPAETAPAEETAPAAETDPAVETDPAAEVEPDSVERTITLDDFGVQFGCIYYPHDYRPPTHGHISELGLWALQPNN